MTTLIWFVVGLLAGGVHATALWRSAHGLSIWSPLIGLLRLGIVAASLVAAAISGAVLANAAGWAVGFAALALGLLLIPLKPAAGSSSASPTEPR